MLTCFQLYILCSIDIGPIKLQHATVLPWFDQPWCIVHGQQSLPAWPGSEDRMASSSESFTHGQGQCGTANGFGLRNINGTWAYSSIESALVHVHGKWWGTTITVAVSKAFQFMTIFILYRSIDWTDSPKSSTTHRSLSTCCGCSCSGVAATLAVTSVVGNGALAVCSSCGWCSSVTGVWLPDCGPSVCRVLACSATLSGWVFALAGVATGACWPACSVSHVAASRCLLKNSSWSRVDSSKTSRFRSCLFFFTSSKYCFILTLGGWDWMVGDGTTGCSVGASAAGVLSVLAAASASSMGSGVSFCSMVSWWQNVDDGKTKKWKLCDVHQQYRWHNKHYNSNTTWILTYFHFPSLCSADGTCVTHTHEHELE